MNEFDKIFDEYGDSGLMGERHFLPLDEKDLRVGFLPGGGARIACGVIK